MARVLAYIPDLLFGSQVQGSLRAEGHQVELATNEPAVSASLADTDVLVVDLTDEASRRLATLQALAAEGALSHVRTLAFYSHVDADTRVLAEDAGLDLVVPRSRMAREGARLVTSLATRPRKRS